MMDLLRLSGKTMPEHYGFFGQRQNEETQNHKPYWGSCTKRG